MNVRAAFLLLAGAASIATAATAAPASFTGSYALSGNYSSDPGLVLQTADLTPGAGTGFTTATLADGASTTFDLFRVWTNETSLQADDLANKAINVSFSFTAPAIFGGTVNGSSFGEFKLFGLFQEGSITWSSPVSIAYGTGGLMQIALSNVDFNTGFLGLNEGRSGGAVVRATLTHISTPAAVPEPGMMALFGLGVLGTAAARRRRAR